MTDCLLKLCAHRALNRTKCHAPALRQSDYCRHHVRVHRPTVVFPAYIYQANTIPDLIQAVRRTVDDTLAGRIKDRLAGQILDEINKRIRTLKPGDNSSFPEFDSSVSLQQQSQIKAADTVHRKENLSALARS